MRKILIVFSVAVALLLVPAGATAAAAQKDVQYSYNNVTLVDADGSSGNYTVVGYVRYSKNGTAYTRCDYFTPPPPGSSTQYTLIGRYEVPYAIADTSYGGVLSFCTQNFANRTPV